VAARKQGNQEVVDDLVLANDALANLGTQSAPSLAKLAGCGDIAFDHLRRRPGDSFASDGSTRKKSRSFL
jgi:hypothetical protein